MHIRWTPAAAADLEQISTYLKDRHPRYRQPSISKLYEAIHSLKQWPNRGRVGREEGTRELLFPPLPYIAVYRTGGPVTLTVTANPGRLSPQTAAYTAKITLTETGAATKTQTIPVSFAVNYQQPTVTQSGPQPEKWADW